MLVKDFLCIVERRNSQKSDDGLPGEAEALGRKISSFKETRRRENREVCINDPTRSKLCVSLESPYLGWDGLGMIYFRDLVRVIHDGLWWRSRDHFHWKNVTTMHD